MIAGSPLTETQRLYNLVREAAEEAYALAHAPENRRNSTGTFEGGRLSGLEQALRLLLEIDPDADAGDPVLDGRAYGPR